MPVLLNTREDIRNEFTDSIGSALTIEVVVSIPVESVSELVTLIWKWSPWYDRIFHGIPNIFE